MINDVYDNRIWFSPEISGSVNTTYMGLDEHLILFFSMLYKERSLIEKKLVQFLASLKYYANHWQRAKQYALLAGFLVESTAASKVTRVDRFTDSGLDELEIRQNDIYMIEFYLHAYSLVKREGRNSFQESKEGFSYLQQKIEETRVQGKVLSWMDVKQMYEWNQKVRAMIVSIKRDPSDEFDTEYVDVDLLLFMYCKEFREQKTKLQNDLQDLFIKQLRSVDIPEESDSGHKSPSNSFTVKKLNKI